MVHLSICPLLTYCLKSNGIKQQPFYYANKLCGQNSEQDTEVKAWCCLQLSGASVREIPETGAPQFWGLDRPSRGCWVWFLGGGDLKALSHWTVDSRTYTWPLHVAWTSPSLTAVFGGGTFRDSPWSLLYGILWPPFRRHIPPLLPHSISWSMY